VLLVLTGPHSLIRLQPSLMRGWEGDQTGEGRDNRFSFRMADDERRVLVAQSLGRDQHPYAVKQFGLSVETGNVQRKQFGPRRPRQRVNRPAQALFPPLRRMNVASGSLSICTPRVPPHARPLGSRSPADLSTISGAENYCGERFVAVGSADVL
jgi:hypothetical protein